MYNKLYKQSVATFLTSYFDVIMRVLRHKYIFEIKLSYLYLYVCVYIYTYIYIYI